MVITVVLARVLGLKPFGILAAAWLVVNLANLVADLGMGSALLQRSTISDDDVRYAFTMQACVGIGLMGVAALSAPLIGHIFNETKVVPVLQAMSLIFVLQTLGGIAVCLLKREMDFKAIQFARISSYLTGFLGLGIPLALSGFEVWSLVVAQLSQTTLFSLLCYVHVRHPIKPLFSLPSSGLRQFGSKVLVTNLINYLISSLDTLFLGRFFDVVILGLYNRAYVLVSFPMNSVVATVQQVTFSAYSRLQNDLRTVRRGYLAGVGFMTMLMLPTFGCVALVPGSVIFGLFGNQWEAATPFLVPLALAMPFHAVMATGGPMLWATDKVAHEFVAQLITAIVSLILLFATASISATALVWGVFGVSVFRFVLITHASLNAVGASWQILLRPVRGSIVLFILTGGTVFFIDWALLVSDVPASSRLVIDMLMGAGVFLATIVSIPRLIFSPEMNWLTARVSEQLPAWMRPLLEKISSSAGVAA